MPRAEPGKRRVGVLRAIALGSLAAGCSLIVPSVADLAGGGPLAGTGGEGGVADDASPRDGDDTDGASARDDGATDARAPDADVANGCPSGRGPAMVALDGYCIDSTEVTAAQYTLFLADKGGDTSGQPARCAWNVRYEPNYAWPPATGDESLPVVGVDWCDAWSFCAWAGKRLCGAVDGGAVPSSGENDPAVDQWFRACSHRGDGVHAYPYGNAYDASACNTNAGGRKPVASLSTCEGGFAGVFDMSGNVLEWEDRCDTAADAAADPCHVRGGSFNGNDVTAKCASGFLPDRSYAISEIGFRCCAP